MWWETEATSKLMVEWPRQTVLQSVHTIEGLRHSAIKPPFMNTPSIHSYRHNAVMHAIKYRNAIEMDAKCHTVQ